MNGWRAFADAPHVPFSIYWALDAPTRDVWLVVLPRVNAEKRATHWHALTPPESPTAEELKP